jgi:hypothetical protein
MSECGTLLLTRFPLPEGLVAGAEYQVVITLEPKTAKSLSAQETLDAASPAENGAARRVFNLQLGSRRDEVIKKLLLKYRLPRYQLLDMVISEVQTEENGAMFRQFFLRYEDPRRISGGQVHFQISSGTQEFLHKASWDYGDGNRSKVARAAIEFICR